MKNIILIFTIALAALQSQAQLKTVTYKDGVQKLNGVAAISANPLKGNPGVLILPAWRGIDDHSKQTAEKLAALGYSSFVADIYGEGNYPKDSEEAGKQSGYYKKNYAEYHKRISVALQQLILSGANKDKIVIIGYCFGGTGALEAARAGMNVKGVVTFHGGLGKDALRSSNPMTAKVLVCHGADDTFVPPAEIAAFHDEMRTSKADWQMIYYANAVHGFTEPSAGNDNSKGVAYNEKAARRSWEHFMDFLQEVLE
jgi:dienelactone hydrolase